MALDSTKDYIRTEIRSNLEGHAMDHLNLEIEKDIRDYIESQKDTIEKALENCLDEQVFQMMKEEGFDDINEYILSQQGDFFRECMCGVGIPGWENDEDED
jgi:hypothetical protein